MHFRAWACTDWAQVLGHYSQDGQDAEAVLGNSGILLTSAGPVAERLATRPIPREMLSRAGLDCSLTRGMRTRRGSWAGRAASFLPL